MADPESKQQYDERQNFEGWEPRECGEHRTVGPHRAWCHGCGTWCYPRLAAACDGCRNPTIESLIDDLADVLSRVTVGWKPVLGVDLCEYPDVVAVMKRYRTYKDSE